uniref:putative transcription factor bHLH041 n=1 Tax=Erigeron canadensis TaxID=72917 RepID=UPI001CB8D7A3|nr:putative transcription factor bHLH041 [Erigeron canadensis]
MDSIFNLGETERWSWFQQIINSFGLSYVCIWSHFLHPSNCLIYKDGVYKDDDNQASSSSSSSSGSTLAMRFFLNYQKSMFLIDRYNGGVPGYAFIHDLRYVERKGLELLRLASNSAQVQFYQEARIKTAIFMGCKNGEIELGLANDSSHINFETELRKLFPGDFQQDVLPQQLGQARESSSSSSLQSLSMDNSAEYSPFLFNMIQTTSHMPEMMTLKGPNQATRRSTEDRLQEALNQIRTTQLIPSRELEEAAMTRAIIEAISSPHQQPQNHRVASAFQRYGSSLGPTKQRNQGRQNLIRRSLSFFRNLSEARAQQNQMIQTTRPTSNQLHHMISERKRREKINESFQALRALLPPGSKKDKAAVLSNSREYITSLKSQVDELSKKNKILEMSKKEAVLLLNQDCTGSAGERQNVITIRDVGESTSESRVVDLEVVNARGNLKLVDLMAGVLELVKRVENATVISLNADTQTSSTLDQQPSANRLVLRLLIQGDEWDKSSLQEEVTRLLDDLEQ